MGEHDRSRDPVLHNHFQCAYHTNSNDIVYSSYYNCVPLHEDKGYNKVFRDKQRSRSDRLHKLPIQSPKLQYDEVLKRAQKHEGRLAKKENRPVKKVKEESPEHMGQFKMVNGHWIGSTFQKLATFVTGYCVSQYHSVLDQHFTDDPMEMYNFPKIDVKLSASRHGNLLLYPQKIIRSCGGRRSDFVNPYIP